MNIWHDMNPDRVSENQFDVIIEISKYSKAKYELDKENGMLRLDRVLHTSTHYPSNYGFIPLTYADDNDPLDVLVLSSEQFLPMTIVTCYPVGVVIMEDEGYLDEKIIAIPLGEPVYTSYKNIEELPPHKINEIMHFFRVYKSLEGKETAVESMQGLESAKNIIRKALNSYQEKFKK